MTSTKWNKTYNEDDNSELRKLQLAELKNMGVFMSICEKYDLRYFLIGGTMLGAIRHKGFIPWDDDMDLGMPRPDYETFLSVVQDEVPEGYSFLNYKTDKSYKRYFSRIVNDSVVVRNASNSKTIEERAWVDIFPFDGMPSNCITRMIHFWCMTFKRFLYHASCFEELVNLNRPGRPWYLKIIIRFLAFTHFGSNIDTKKQLDRVEKSLLKYNYDKCSYVVNLFGAYLSREIISKDLLGSLPCYRFEDIDIPGAEQYDKYLRNFYGDYMTPPKNNEKDKHNIIEVAIHPGI